MSPITNGVTLGDKYIWEEISPESPARYGLAGNLDVA
jgi:hypothetical protein